MINYSSTSRGREESARSASRNKRDFGINRRDDQRTRVNYSSTSRGREESARSASRNRRDFGIKRTDFNNMRGWSFRNEDRMRPGNKKYCEKCGSWFHYTWACQKYERFSKYECKVCNKSLHHWDRDRRSNSRDNRTQRPPSRDRRDRSNSRDNMSIRDR
jgi:hypothetical protein